MVDLVNPTKCEKISRKVNKSIVCVLVDPLTYTHTHTYIYI